MTKVGLQICWEKTISAEQKQDKMHIAVTIIVPSVCQSTNFALKLDSLKQISRERVHASFITKITRSLYLSVRLLVYIFPNTDCCNECCYPSTLFWKLHNQKSVLYGGLWIKKRKSISQDSLQVPSSSSWYVGVQTRT